MSKLDDKENQSTPSEGGRDESTYVPMRDTSQEQVRTGNTDGWIIKRNQ